MGKHNKARLEKDARNDLYRDKFRQRECKDCKHKSSRRGKCVMCTGEMR